MNRQIMADPSPDISANGAEMPSTDRTHTTDFTQQHNAPTRNVYAILDSVTDNIIGGLQIHLNAASAIRTLYDVAMADTLIHKHPEDFDLWLLGSLTPDHQLVTTGRIKIITGLQIKAAIDHANETKKEK